MRIVVYDELESRGIRYSREHLRRLEKQDPPGFPQHINLGPGRIGWLEAEIDAWVEGLAAKRTLAAAAELGSSDKAFAPSSKAPQRTTPRNASKPPRAGPRIRRSDQDNRPDQFA